MAFKGEVKENREVLPGTPVEVVREAKLPDYYYHRPPLVGTLGVVSEMMAHEAAKGGYTQAKFHPLVEGKLGTQVSLLEYGPKSAPLFKVLTGTKGEELKKLWYGALLTVNVRGAGKQVGSDPEVFVVDEAGVVIPAWKFLPRKKEGKDVTPQAFWDGFQAEVTILPSHCHAFVGDNIHEMLRQVSVAAKKYNPKARLTHECVVPIPQEMMEAAAAESEEYVQLGCAPSMNIYEDDSPLRVVEGRMCPIRFAGFHIHHEYGKLLPEQVRAVVSTMDAICGVVLVLVCRGLEHSDRRRFYGRAGEHRLPKWGLEWRVPSSAVLAHPVMMHLCLDLARASGQVGLLGLRGAWKASEEEVRETVNTLDVDQARKIVERNDGVLRILLEKVYTNGQSYSTGTAVKNALRLIQEGAVEVLDTTSLEKNWRLGGEGWVGHSESRGCSVGKATFKC